MASLTIRKLDDDAQEAPAPARRAERPLDGGRGRAPSCARAAAGEDVRAEAQAGKRRGSRRSTPEQPKPAPGDAAGPGAKRVLLIIGGGIAAYKSLDLIRRLRERGMAVRCMLTRRRRSSSRRCRPARSRASACFTDLFDAATEFDVGHIRLAREADLVVVAPATADLMAKMAGGHADDLATAVLLATDRPVLIAPAMNPHMWAHAATRRNLAQLAADGVAVVGPNAGEMAEAARPATAAWRSRSRSSPAVETCSASTGGDQAARGQARGRHLGADA